MIRTNTIQWIAIISLFLIFSLKTEAQCYSENTVVKAGEKVYFDVYYNWGFIWVSAAEAIFEVNHTEYKGNTVFHFKSFGRSLPSYDWLYKVRDVYEAYADTSNLKPYWFNRNTSEGNYKVNNEYSFDHANKKIYSKSENSKKPLVRDTIQLPDCIYDMQAAIYHARNLDFSQLKIGEKIPIKMLIDNEIADLYIRYMGRDTIQTKNGIKYACIKFTALMMEGSIFNGGEDVEVWVTDDQNKIPVLVEAKILVGSVKAYLSKYTGLRNESTAILKN
ncbi:MAG: DUF3108 domain-containing protein [Marinilabiliales bacterium]|nr:MAG: DUF3108 domain-containing protein [Marinilabiliales bacterium]